MFKNSYDGALVGENETNGYDDSSTITYDMTKNDNFLGVEIKTTVSMMVEWVTNKYTWGGTGVCVVENCRDNKDIQRCKDECMMSFYGTIW